MGRPPAAVGLHDLYMRSNVSYAKTLWNAVKARQDKQQLLNGPFKLKFPSIFPVIALLSGAGETKSEVCNMIYSSELSTIQGNNETLGACTDKAPHLYESLEPEHISIFDTPEFTTSMLN